MIQTKHLLLATSTLIAFSAHAFGLNFAQGMCAGKTASKSKNRIVANYRKANVTIKADDGTQVDLLLYCRKILGSDKWKIKSCASAATPDHKIPYDGVSTVSDGNGGFFRLECFEKKKPKITVFLMEQCMPQIAASWEIRAKNKYKVSKGSNDDETQFDFSINVTLANSSDVLQQAISLLVACVDDSPTVRRCIFPGKNRFLEAVTVDAGFEADVTMGDDAAYRLKCNEVSMPEILVKQARNYADDLCDAKVKAELKDREVGSPPSDATTEFTGTRDIECGGCDFKTYALELTLTCFGPAPVITKCRRRSPMIKKNTIVPAGSTDVVNTDIFPGASCFCHIGCNRYTKPTLSSCCCSQPC